jgi:hypothetical protein
MATKKISISIPELFHEAALEKIAWQGGNFSGYVSHLVAMDNQDTIKRLYEERENKRKTAEQWEAVEKLSEQARIRLLQERARKHEEEELSEEAKAHNEKELEINDNKICHFVDEGEEGNY